jgi:23S rRNA (guanosine2251-2'-O)-methyltransferase
MWVAGRRAVLEAIRGGRVSEVPLGDWVKTVPWFAEIRTAAEERQIRLRVVPWVKLDDIDPNHRGVAARIAGSQEVSDRGLGGWEFGPSDVVVVLDGITDPQNLGAAARAAEAAGVAMLVTRVRRAAGVTSSAVRASAGALLHLPVARVTNLTRTLKRLKDGGFTVVGLHGSASQTIYQERCPEGRVALVVGSEGEGMSRLVRESCDVLVALPMRGNVESLNASAALAAALYGFVLPSRT